MTIATDIQSPKIYNFAPWALSSSLCLAGFLYDWLTPLGVAGGLIYTVFILSGVFLDSNRIVFLFAGISSALTIFGYFHIPDSIVDTQWIIVLNRTMTIMVLWATAYLAYAIQQSLHKTKAAQAHTEAIIKSAIDSIVLINERGKILNFNPASIKLFGYSFNEAVGQNVKILMPEHYARQHDQFLDYYFKTGQERFMGENRQMIGKRKDGSEFPMDITVGKLTAGNQTHFIGIIRDISKRIEAEQARDQMINDLTKSNQALDDFAYIASHDLKEPLRGLANNAMFFAEDYAETLDEDGNKRIDRMCTLTKRMEKLIDNLLYFSRLGRQDLAIQQTNINDLIGEITGMIDTLIEEEAVQINIIKPLPSIICDRHRIAEVFRNLITNAIKYNDKPEKLIDIDFLPEKDGRENVFSVKDNGIGIAPEYHADIFKIFKRLNVEEEKARGTGVGLTFVQKIIERHKGEIWLESEPDLGTTFYFTINSREEDNDTA
ncbi:sensor histidine kinase [Kiloniella majae]|uniref:sensor histidine kinase n=1 Tax=Kiloniella majae TaxID=1938558 RepID=UPI000A277F88|nr:PAS domain-containing sensor histidine kinase [Kiloniella majae]